MKLPWKNGFFAFIDMNDVIYERELFSDFIMQLKP
jgi:hypothetical protein